MKKKLSIEIGLSQGLLVPSLSALCTYDIVCPFGRAWYLKRWHFVFGSHTEKRGQARDSRFSTHDTDKPYVVSSCLRAMAMSKSESIVL